MDLDTLRHFKELFMAMKAKHLQLAQSLEHDFSWDIQENDLKKKLEMKRNRHLRKIDDALFRIENGTFGYCIECLSELEMEKLFAKPTTTHCSCCLERQRTLDAVSSAIEKMVIPIPERKEDTNILYLKSSDDDVLTF